jgi:hypothetical protein
VPGHRNSHQESRRNTSAGCTLKNHTHRLSVKIVLYRPKSCDFTMSPQDDVNRLVKLATATRHAQQNFDLDSLFGESNPVAVAKLRKPAFAAG